MNTNYQTNPFQQNVDILKGFFKRPIVLVTAILMGVSSLLSMFSGIFVDKALTQFLSSLPYEVRRYIGDTSTATSGFSLPILAILTTVAFFLFYFFSKNNSSELKVPATMFKVVSIIELVLVCVVAGIVILAFSVTSVAIGYLYGAQNTAVLLIGVIIVCLIVLGIAIWFCATKVKFACSIKKSTKSIYLFKNGAKIFGVLTIIFSGISCLAVLSSLSVSDMGFMTFAGLVSAASNILLGVTAIQYANYIKEVSAKFTTQPVYGSVNPEPYNPENFAQTTYGTPYSQPAQPVYEQQPDEDPATDDVAPTEEAPAVETDSFCSACGNPVKADDYFCNNCGNKLK